MAVPTALSFPKAGDLARGSGLIWSGRDLTRSVLETFTRAAVSEVEVHEQGAIQPTTGGGGGDGGTLQQES